MAEKETRIILLGKTGSGKSSLGNTIFGEKIFTAKCSSISVTDDCKSHTKQINGQTIRLFDTPGVFDTEQNKSDLGEKFYSCVKDCAPGPHAFLLVFRVDRFTKQEEDVVKEILSYFSEEALKYTTVVFTRGDELEGQKIEDWYNENEALRSLVQKCGGRCHVFDNKCWNNSHDSYRNNQVQVRELLRTINETVEKNGGGCYTNGIWKHLKYMKILGVPLKYLLLGLLGAAVVVVVGVALVKGVGTRAMSEGVNTMMSEEVNTMMSEEVNTMMSEEVNTMMSEEVNTMMSEEVNTMMSEGVNTMMSEGVNTMMSEEVNTMMSEGVNTMMSEGVNTMMSEEVNTMMSEGVNTMMSEGVNTMMSEGVNTMMSEGVNAVMSEEAVSTIGIIISMVRVMISRFYKN